MQAQVRTIVAASGERLVVLPEAQYAALISAAGDGQARSSQQMGQATAGAASVQMGQATSSSQMMAATPAAASVPKRAPRPAVRPVAVAPVAEVAAPAEAAHPRQASLNDVLLFG